MSQRFIGTLRLDALHETICTHSPSPAPAQRNAKVPDPDLELERKALQLADGFEINLYAADPLLAKPIQMKFDPQGRSWIATEAWSSPEVRT